MVLVLLPYSSSIQLPVSQGVLDEDMLEYTGFLVVEPALNIEINIIKEIKLIVGGGYRWVSVGNLDTLEDADLAGFNINVGLRMASY